MYKCLAVMLLIAAHAHAQWIIGFGPGYAHPIAGSPYAQVNASSGSGAITLCSRQYCDLWYGVRLEHSPLAPRTTLQSNQYAYASSTTLAGELRWFPFLPTDVPLFALATLGFNSTGTQPAERLAGMEPGSPTGLGYSLGLGVLVPYSSNCCGWFLSVTARYVAANGLLRSRYRPLLANWEAALMFNIGL